MGKSGRNQFVLLILDCSQFVNIRVLSIYMGLGNCLGGMIRAVFVFYLFHLVFRRVSCLLNATNTSFNSIWFLGPINRVNDLNVDTWPLLSLVFWWYTGFQSLIQFQSRQNAISARTSLQVLSHCWHTDQHAFFCDWLVLLLIIKSLTQ